MATRLRPVARQSLAGSVYEQLTDEILAGRIAPGEALPAERVLTQTFGVNRQAVREALQRLAQAGLVDIRQGESTRVRDYRRSAGLDLLGDLLTSPAGAVDARVIRSVMELRAAVGPDAARLCALRATPTVLDALDSATSALTTAADVAARAQASIRFWDTIIDGSDNIAYRLLYNALLRVYEPASADLAPLLAAELEDDAGHRALYTAIAAGDGPGARSAAGSVLALGTFAVHDALEGP